MVKFFFSERALAFAPGQEPARTRTSLHVMLRAERDLARARLAARDSASDETAPDPFTAAITGLRARLHCQPLLHRVETLARHNSRSATR